MARTAVLATLVALLTALPTSGAASDAVVKNTNGWVESIAMDGARAAYAVRGKACTRLLVWNVRSGAGERVSGRRTCAADSTSTGAGVREIALAGKRIAWIVNLGGNSESGDYLYAASLFKPKEQLVLSAVRTGEVGGTLAGGWIGGLVGHADLLAVNVWQTDASGDVTSAALRLIRPGGLATILSGLAGLGSVSADADRLAVARSDGSVALFTSRGAALRTIVPPSIAEVALQGGDLAVLTRSRTLEVHSAATGYRRSTWPVAAGAARLDVAGGIAVYSAYRTVHVLRLSDGKDVVLASAPRAIAGLQLETAGAVYAYNTIRGGKEVGTLVFVPLAKAISLLG